MSRGVKKSLGRRRAIWRRWWRHPERNLMRKQFRCGIRFWRRWPWNIVFVCGVSHKACLMFVPFSIPFLYDIVAYLPPLALVIACSNCLQDGGMSLFRGVRLGELLVTPSGPRRYFPALLLAPITAWVFVHALIAIVEPVMLFSMIWLRHVPLTGFHVFLGQAAMDFLMSSAIMAAAAATVAAWTIGKNRTEALIKSILGISGMLIGLTVLAGFSQWLSYYVFSAYDLNFGAISVILYSPSYEFFSFIPVVISMVIWHIGMKRLRGPGTIARLQKAMESAG